MKAEEYVHVGESLRTGQREKPGDDAQGLRRILCLTAPAPTHHGVHPTRFWRLLETSPPGQNYFRKKYMVSNSFLFACGKKKKYPWTRNFEQAHGRVLSVCETANAEEVSDVPGKHSVRPRLGASETGMTGTSRRDGQSVPSRGDPRGPWRRGRKFSLGCQTPGCSPALTQHSDRRTTSENPTQGSKVSRGRARRGWCRWGSPGGGGLGQWGGWFPAGCPGQQHPTPPRHARSLEGPHPSPPVLL